MKRCLVIAFAFFAQIAFAETLNPFLFSVTKPNHPPSFVFGSLHVPFPEKDFPDYFWKAFDSVPSTAFETLIELTSEAKASTPAPILPASSDVIISESTKVALRERGIPQLYWPSPSICSFYMLWDSLSRDEDHLDTMLEKHAIKRNQRRLQLDKEDIRAGADAEIQASQKACDISALTSVFSPQELVGLNERWINSYRSGIEHARGQCNPSCKQRTEYWMPKIDALFRSQPSFVVVGVAHLWEDDGLLHLLEKRGYKVERVTSLAQVNALIQSIDVFTRAKR